MRRVDLLVRQPAYLDGNVKMTEHFFDHISEPVKHILDALSIMTVLGTLVNILPAIAAILSIVWSVIRIYESKTFKSWIGKNDA